MAAPGRVSDEVWARLDPGTGRSPQRSRRITIASATIVALLIICWYLASITGMTRPRLQSNGDWSAQFSTTDRTVSQTFTVTNDSWVSTTVTGVTSPVAGLRVDGVDGLPATMHRGEQITVTVHYQVTDCSRFVDRPSLGPTLPSPRVQVSRWWGTMSVPISSMPGSLLTSACS